MTQTEKLLNLVASMNALNEQIDPCYGKMAVYLTHKEGDNEVSVRYFIKKRTFVDVDGIERWKFVAREEK